MSKNNLSN